VVREVEYEPALLDAQTTKSPLASAGLLLSFKHLASPGTRKQRRLVPEKPSRPLIQPARRREMIAIRKRSARRSRGELPFLAGSEESWQATRDRAARRVSRALVVLRCTGWPCPGPVDTAHLARAFAININLGETDEDVQAPQGTLELEARDQKPASMATALRDPTRTN
jgi:hypothetical protein